MTAVNPSPPKPAPAPPDHALVAETVRTRLPFRAELSRLVPLAGDASNRRYFRLELAGLPVPSRQTGGTPRSLILMQLAEPEAFKQSEEAVSGATVQITELPYINVLNHLAKADVAVPALYHYDQRVGLLYLEDFGDLLLVQVCQHATSQDIAALYRLAIDTLVRIQVRATSPANPACVAFHRRFDVPLLMWELDHFLEYGVVARAGRAMAPDDEKQVRAAFQQIAELLAAQSQVFTHRDYHSRNLMVRDSPPFHSALSTQHSTPSHRLGILDFQDALLGPATYDLASLLRDAYIELEEPVVDEMINHYLEGMARHGAKWPDRAAFRRLFDLTSIQRNLKAAGRFIYIDRVKQNPSFLADIPRTLGYVRRNLEKYPELTTLKTHLAPYVPELQ